MTTTKMVIDVHIGKLIVTVLDEIVQLKAAHSVLYPFATFPKQCSYVDYLNLLVSNPSFQGKIRSDLEDVPFKAKRKRRRRRQWKKESLTY